MHNYTQILFGALSRTASTRTQPVPTLFRWINANSGPKVNTLQHACSALSTSINPIKHPSCAFTHHHRSPGHSSLVPSCYSSPVPAPAAPLTTHPLPQISVQRVAPGLTSVQLFILCSIAAASDEWRSLCERSVGGAGGGGGRTRPWQKHKHSHRHSLFLSTPQYVPLGPAVVLQRKTRWRQWQEQQQEQQQRYYYCNRPPQGSLKATWRIPWESNIELI